MGIRGHLVRQPKVADANRHLADVVPHVGHRIVGGERKRLRL